MNDNISNINAGRHLISQVVFGEVKVLIFNHFADIGPDAEHNLCDCLGRMGEGRIDDSSLHRDAVNHG